MLSDRLDEETFCNCGHRLQPGLLPGVGLQLPYHQILAMLFCLSRECGSVPAALDLKVVNDVPLHSQGKKKHRLRNSKNTYQPDCFLSFLITLAALSLCNAPSLAGFAAFPEAHHTPICGAISRTHLTFRKNFPPRSISQGSELIC